MLRFQQRIAYGFTRKTRLSHGSLGILSFAQSLPEDFAFPVHVAESPARFSLFLVAGLLGAIMAGHIVVPVRITVERTFADARFSGTQRPPRRSLQVPIIQFAIYVGFWQSLLANE